VILLPFESKNQFFYLLYNEPDVFMEWVEKYGVPAEFKVGSTKHWLRKINQMEPNRNRRSAEDYKRWEIKTIMWYPLVIGFLGGTLATVAGNILSALYLKRNHGLWADKE
jgi:hypothetical protein